MTGVLQRGRARLMRSVFERGDFVDTGVVVQLDELGLDAPDRVGYVPSRWSVLPRALRGERISPDDVFVDFGAGMGRVLCQAARYPFGRVVGVELSPRLNTVARENVERNRERFRCREIELFEGDALEFEVPDEMTYAFMFNPFGGETFRRVVDRMLESLERAPRTLTLIYLNPCEGPYLEATGRFRRARRIKRPLKPREPNSWVDVYVSVSEPATGERVRHRPHEDLHVEPR